MSTSVSLVLQDGEGEHRGFAGGGVFTFKAMAADTGGAFLLWEHRSVGGKATPLHTHPEDEAIYVLQGDLLVHLDGEEHRLGQGGFFLAPAGVPHAMLVVSETARLLGLQTPGSGEQFYRDASDPADADADASWPPDFDRLRDIAKRSDTIEILGPPPFAAKGEEAAVAAS